MSVKVVMNMAGLVEISNIVNDTIAIPKAEQIAARAGGEGYEVRPWRRPGVEGWARTRILTTTPKTMIREVRHGTLARALEGA